MVELLLQKPYNIVMETISIVGTGFYGFFVGRGFLDREYVFKRNGEYYEAI